MSTAHRRDESGGDGDESGGDGDGDGNGGDGDGRQRITALPGSIASVGI